MPVTRVFNRSYQAVEKFFDKFLKDNTTTLAASLSYYATLSVAPLLILFITLSSQMGTNMQDEFIVQVNALIGERAAEAIRLIIETAKDRPDLQSMSGFIGALTLAISASAVFGELKSSLNIVFECTGENDKDKHPNAVWAFLQARLLSVGFVLSFIFILLVSLILSSVISVFLPPGEQGVVRFVSWTISFLMQGFIFCLLYRYVPDRRIGWKASFRSGLITAALFVTGKELVGLYLGNSAVGSAYGAAGSLIVLLIWIYYSAMIVFSGAQVSFLMEKADGTIRSEEPRSAIAPKPV